MMSCNKYAKEPEFEKCTAPARALEKAMGDMLLFCVHPQKAMMDAILTDDVEQVALLMAAGVNVSDRWGCYAVRLGHWDIVKFLIQTACPFHVDALRAIVRRAPPDLVAFVRATFSFS